MVTCNGYRNPALLAKIASTVDVMSHGRLIFGFGAGWYEHEWRAYGYGFPDVPTRMGMFREACEIIHRMWTEAYPVFQGKYYTIDKPINEPKGVQKPHPPFWIGGGGEKVTLKLVAKWGDACNLGGPPQEISHKLDVLRQHCQDAERNYDDIVKSTSLNVYPIEPGRDPERATARVRGEMKYSDFASQVTVGDAGTIRDKIEPLLEAGIDYLITYIPGVAYDHEPLHRFEADVMPLVTQPTPTAKVRR
jgi:alkanesulfonate monooxygenase SsuD/methylene tetrahydromethanopterin reductase-like flavin-dependent oxidoreductase (luciferase family)